MAVCISGPLSEYLSSHRESFVHFRKHTCLSQETLFLPGLVIGSLGADGMLEQTCPYTHSYIH